MVQKKEKFPLNISCKILINGTQLHLPKEFAQFLPSNTRWEEGMLPTFKRKGCVGEKRNVFKEIVNMRMSTNMGSAFIENTINRKEGKDSTLCTFKLEIKKWFKNHTNQYAITS